MGMRIVTFKIDEKLLEKLDLFCLRNRIYRSEAIRLGIKLLLENNKKQ